MSLASSASQQMHRPDIDGLRAVAIVPVLLFHAHLPGWTGGYLGVDVFFVISGFLITRQLINAPLSGIALLGDFYERRIRRLFPILFLVLLTTWTIAVGLDALTPTGLRSLEGSTLASLAFLQNVHLWRTSGYWQTAAELSPLTHLWSLAVEEQFYLLFPLIFVAPSVRVRRRLIQRICIIVGLASFAAAFWRLGTDSAGAFYLLPYRAWEILAGAAIALSARTAAGPLHLGLPHHLRYGRLLAAIGIAWAIATSDSTTRHPGPVAGVVVAAVAILIATPGSGDAIDRILVHRTAQAIGQRSYGAYLWHYPLLALGRQLGGGALGPWPSAALLVAALALSDATWHAVETPYRDRGRVSRRRLAMALGAGVALIGAVAVSSRLAIFGSGVDAEVVALESQAKVPEVRDDYFEVDFDDGISGASIGLRDRETPWGDVVVWGDSHASSLAIVASDTLRDRGLGGVALIEPGCPPITGVMYSDFDAHCETHERSFPQILGQRGATNVVMFARWTLYFEGTYFVNHRGVAEPTLLPPMEPIAGTWATADERRAYLARTLDAEIDDLERSGKTVVLVYPVPELGWNPVDRAIRFVREGKSWIGELDIPSDVFLARSTRTYRILDSVGSAQTRRVYPASKLCDSYRLGWCAVSDGETLLYADDDHLSARGLAPVVQDVLTALRQP